MDIKLPVPIKSAKTISVSTLHKSQKYFINGLLLHDHILKFHFFVTFSTCKSLIRIF